MAERKKEGFGALKDTKGGKPRDDRQVTSRSTFEPLSIDAKNALTVIYMLQSPEDDVVLRAVASLEGYGRKGHDQLQVLYSFGIMGYLIPLVHHHDTVTKRFSQKLIGMLCSLPEFRDQILKVENILDTFVGILQKEADVVMHEYAGLTLAELSSDCVSASQLLNVEDCVETLFLRINSADPDVQKNCLNIVNHLLMDVKGIETFIKCPTFSMSALLELIPSSYPVIQSLAFEVLDQLTSWCRDTRVLFAFRDASGIETALEVLENPDWIDLHSPALTLLLKVADCSELGDYLAQSGCLHRLVGLLDEMRNKANVERILGILARMSQTHKGRQALHKSGMGKRFSLNLQENLDGIQEPSCLGIANLALYGPSLDDIMSENPIPRLLGIIINRDKNPALRNMAAYALNNLCRAGKDVCESLIRNENFEKLFSVLSENGKLPVEIQKNVIQVFAAISFFVELRAEVISQDFIAALLACIPENEFPMKDASLQVNALECLSGYLLEWTGRSIFNSLRGPEKVINCLRSRYASVREWAGHLVVVASQSADFIKCFIHNDGLQWLIQEKNTRYSMPSWQSAINAVFANFLPAKFAFTGRLDFQDITEDGFYVTSNPRAKFFLLENFLKAKISPIFPTYVVNFDIITSESTSGSDSASGERTRLGSKDIKASETEDLQNQAKTPDKKMWEHRKSNRSFYTVISAENPDSTKYAWDSCTLESFGKFIPDPFLHEYLLHLKRKLSKEEFFFGDSGWFGIHPKLVCDRAKVIAEVVTAEMSGPVPNMKCGRHYKEMHINELRFQLGTNIIPLGFVRTGNFLERAMLFKVLADRIGFPCALVRGSFGRAWIEICIPYIDIEDVKGPCKKIGEKSSFVNFDNEMSTATVKSFESEKTSCESSHTDSLWPEENYWFPKVKMEFFKPFPKNFLKPNAIVDLINVPGKILKLNSREADEYCGLFSCGKNCFN